MNMRGLVTFLLLFPFVAFAQNARPDTVAQLGVKQGVIKVRKPVVRPYFKCEYYLTLARVREVEVLVPAANGIPGAVERDMVPVFDSAYSPAFSRVFPQKSIHLSRMLVEQIEYSYSFEDTASIDTMVVELWIGKNGKVKWQNPDTVYNGDMPRQLEQQLYQSMMGLNEWGKGGGYMTPKKFLRRQKRMAENYYCVVYIISSAKPLTTEQKSTGSRYAPFDIPLNSPPGDEQQKDFIEGNRKLAAKDSIPVD